MTKEELLNAFEMRIDGYTYEDIADSLGYTKQYIHQMIRKILKERDNNAVYPNLKKEIKIKYKTMKNFAENTGFSYRKIIEILNGIKKVKLDDAIWFSEHFKKDISYLFKTKEENEF